jgi:hypothetical protein
MAGCFLTCERQYDIMQSFSNFEELKCNGKISYPIQSIGLAADVPAMRAELRVQPQAVPEVTYQTCVVYRADPRGWSAPVYNASSFAEANDLLTYLKLDDWNKGCHIDLPEPTGDWGIFRQIGNQEYQIAMYTRKWSTIRITCEISLRNSENEQLTVRCVSGKMQSMVYRVNQGKAVLEQ